jgi:hypothetical protein
VRMDADSQRFNWKSRAIACCAGCTARRMLRPRGGPSGARLSARRPPTPPSATLRPFAVWTQTISTSRRRRSQQ